MTPVSSSSISIPRPVAFSRGMAWLTEGFGYFQRDALVWIGITIIWFVITLALAFIPLVGSVAGQILMPVFMGGMMLGCRSRAEGGELQVAHLFAGFSQHSGQLLLVGLLYLAGLIVMIVLIVVLVIFGAGGSAIMPELEGGDVAALSGNLMPVLLISLVTLALYLPLLMACWFAPTLVVLRNIDAVEAMKLSFNGCLRNILPFLLYGIIGLVLSIVAVITLGLGFLVLLPVVIASVYTAYLDIYHE
jgi:uncharacterized membrane protein